MKLTKRKLAIFNSIRTSYIIIYILFVITYLAVSLGGSNISSSKMLLFYYCTQALYVLDFLVVIWMSALLVKMPLEQSQYELRIVRGILIFNLIIKGIMAFIWQTEVIISGELDLIYYILEAVFILVSIIILGSKRDFENN